MDNKTKIDRIHELLPRFLNTQRNVNWSGLIEAIGAEDETLAQLITEVRKQFFIKTAQRPYIDVLAANNNVVRPRLVGMSDQSFRNYIPVLSYQPKQVKLIVDMLLDIFFFKESTTAFLMSTAVQPFTLQDAWDLQLAVDGIYDENIVFHSADFTNIAIASADEIVAAYNRQSKYSYATNFYDSITKYNYIRIFTKTVGAKGSLEIIGGRANVALQLNGFITSAGNGLNTQWTVTKVGDTTTFAYSGGADPGLNQLQIGDILISNIPGNAGSFPITDVNIAQGRITFSNLFATPGIYTQAFAEDTKYVRPEKFTVYKVARRAITWETTSGEVTVEMPTTPPVVQRSLKGSWHINGVFSLTTSINSPTSLTVVNAAGFPRAGSFWIEHVDAVTSHIITTSVDEVVTRTFNGRLISNVQKYTYASRIALSTTGNTVTDNTQILVASVAGLTNGMTIFADGLREDAVITNISGNTVTSSVAPTKTLTGTPVEFGDNTLRGIIPNLPDVSALSEITLSSVSRTSNVVTVDAGTAHNYHVGENVAIHGCTGIPVLSLTGDLHSSKLVDNISSTANIVPGQLVIGSGIPSGTIVSLILSANSILLSNLATTTANTVSLQFNEDLNGNALVATVPDPTHFTFVRFGADGAAATPGVSSIEWIGLAPANSKIIITGSQSAANTRIFGPYAWDTAAPFVLSSNTAVIQDNVTAGTIVRLLNISANELPAEGGFIIFDYGQNTEEGPVRYMYKPADNVLALDSSYIFKKDHLAGSSITAISHKGPHVMDGLANEYGLYVTDPSEARVILETLIKSVTSAGVFINFLVRYPEQLYATLDVYKSGVLPTV